MRETPPFAFFNQFPADPLSLIIRKHGQGPSAPRDGYKPRQKARPAEHNMSLNDPIFFRYD